MSGKKYALDHYLADKCFSDAPRGLFASSAWLHDCTPIPHALNDSLYACFKSIFLDSSGTQPSTLFKASSAVDKQLNSVYWSLPEEIAARAFEAYVQDHAICNHFLVKGTKASKEAEMGLFPQGEQREQINRAFAEYFQRLGGAVARSSQPSGNR